MRTDTRKLKAEKFELWSYCLIIDGGERVCFMTLPRDRHAPPYDYTPLSHRRCGIHNLDFLGCVTIKADVRALVSLLGLIYRNVVNLTQPEKDI